ncbi:papain family cysteine protease domain-containing protein [Phthorimaea operculella]|nr:papain family cysteine protease domain-containing protein [Phthorimaea operculella]
MQILVLFLALFCASSLAHVQPPLTLYDLEDAEDLFEEFINNYNKEYSSEEEKQLRFNAFKHNLEHINALRLSEKGKLASFDITHHSDWTKEEFQSTFGLKFDSTTLFDAEPVDMTKELPENFDWRQYIDLTPAKNQDEPCGSCWAFSTIGAIEAAYTMKHKKVLSLSEQQLVDCVDACGGCGGCYGIDTAVKYLAQRHAGVELESDYPYEHRNDRCRFNASKVKAKVVNSKTFSVNETRATKQALVQNGPMIVGVVATSDWLHYHGGILDCPDIGFQGHAVVLVGYGTDITHKSDWTEEDFQSTFGLKFHSTTLFEAEQVDMTKELPENFDWRQYIDLTPAKNQDEPCGSCWAFSTIGAIEAAYTMKHKKVLSLSEQQLVDCVDA